MPSALKEKGHLYIFDAALRNHQKPDDFSVLLLMELPILSKIMVRNCEINTSNSPVEALIYY